MLVDFTRPIFLLFLFILPLFYFLYRKYLNISYKAFLIRIFLVVILILGLSGFSLNIPVRDQNIMLIADSSLSISDEQSDNINEFISETLRFKDSEDRIGIINFAAEPVIENVLEEDLTFSRMQSSPNPYFTNIESALQLAKNSIQKTVNQRIVLISDGNENQGDALDMAHILADAGIPVDVYPLEQKIEPEVLIKSMAGPDIVDQDESFRIRINIQSNVSTTADLFVQREDSTLLRDEVLLEEGENIFTYNLELNETGLNRLRVLIEPQIDTKQANNVSDLMVQVRGDKKILFAGEQDEGAAHLSEALSETDYEFVFKTPSEMPGTAEQLSAYNGIVLNNISADSFTGSQLQALNVYVYERGGGLMVFGGEQSLGPGDYTDTALESMLPVESALRQEVVFSPLTLLLIIDKSGSMGEELGDAHNLTKMDLAKQASAAALNTLQDSDRIGITAFDVSSELVVPLQDIEDRGQILDRIMGISPGGGTDIYTALEHGYEILKDVESPLKHIILLSDGISLPGDFEGIVNSLREEDITLSTVSMGESVDREFMRQLAEWGAGESYYTADLTDIPQIYISEVQRIPRRAVREEEFYPRLPGESFLLEGIDTNNIPLLSGYVATTPRDQADHHLLATENYPLLSTWNYGLGRSAVFTSNLGEKWTSEWLNWEQFDVFSRNLFNWLTRDFSSQYLSADLNIDGISGEIVVNALDDEGNYLNFLDFEVNLRSPHSEGLRQFNLEQAGPGLYRSEIEAGQSGVYTAEISTEVHGREINVLVSDVLSYSPEYRVTDTNYELLSGIAENTGGRVLSSAREIFSERAVSYERTADIWVPLLIFALFLFLLDVGLRMLGII